MERMVACGSNEMEQNDTEDAVQPETLCSRRQRKSRRTQNTKIYPQKTNLYPKSASCNAVLLPCCSVMCCTVLYLVESGVSAAADGPALAVEEGEADACLLRHGRQSLLSFDAIESKANQSDVTNADTNTKRRKEEKKKKAQPKAAKRGAVRDELSSSLSSETVIVIVECNRNPS